MSSSHALHQVDWATAGALGEPGDRTFLLQAQAGAEYVAVLRTRSSEELAVIADFLAELVPGPDPKLGG